MTQFEAIIQTITSIILSYKFYGPLITICITFFLVKISKKTVKRLVKDSKSIEVKKRNTIVALGENILKYFFIIIALLIILAIWGVDITSLVTGLGIVGVVGGLAIQDALKDIIAGVNIIMDNFFVVGDIVKFNDFTGEVIEFGLKNTKIKNVDGVVLVVSNREIASIYNLSQKSSSVAIIVPVAYEEKEEKVAQILTDVCKQIDELKLTTKNTEYLGIDSLGDSSVNYLVRAYCNAGDQYELKRKILGLIKNELDKKKVKIPYPQVEVHNG